MKRAISLLFNFLKRKQILFALFAIVLNYFFNDSEVLFSIVPVIAAGAAAGAAAGGGAAAAGGAAAGGAAAGGAAAGGAAAGGAAGGAASGSAAGSAAANSTAVSGAKSASTVADKSLNSAPKNVNPNSNTINTQRNLPNSNVSNDLVHSKNMPMNDELAKDNLKDSSKGEFEKDKDKSKRRNKAKNHDLTNSDDEEEVDDESSLEDVSSQIVKNPGAKLFGCVFFGFLIFIFSIPILFLLLINPTSNAMSQVDCSISNSKECVEQMQEEQNSILHKFKNLILYGSFGTNSKVIADNVKEVYDKIFEETGKQINIPLLLSTVLADSKSMQTEVGDNNEYVVPDEILNRMEHLEDVARIQLIEDYVVFKCNSKEVNGRVVYYKETDYSNIDPETVSIGVCNASTVGMTLKEESVLYDDEEYYDRLKENSDLLKEIYIDYKDLDNIDILLSMIRNQYTIYNALYLKEYETKRAGNIPMNLFYDSSINLSSPLKGKVSITSPYGMRSGKYSGMHYGIDIISDDENIYAAGDGIITNRYTDTYEGNVIEITHFDSLGNKYISAYFHMREFLASKGDEVKAGDIIGIMGDTGRVTGKHLHFQIKDMSTNKFFNPANILSVGVNR